MAKISELPQILEISGTELIPVVSTNENGIKENKVIVAEKLAEEIKNTQNLVNREELEQTITDRQLPLVTEQKLQDALTTKSGVNHNHDSIYSNKLHTHSYLDLTGLPEIPNVSQQDIEDLSNRLEEANATITTMQMDIESLNNTITSLVETIGLLEGRIMALENSAQTPTQNS